MEKLLLKTDEKKALHFGEEGLGEVEGKALSLSLSLTHSLSLSLSLHHVENGAR